MVRAARITLAAAALGALYARYLRRRVLTWGATAGEADGRLLLLRIALRDDSDTLGGAVPEEILEQPQGTGPPDVHRHHDAGEEDQVAEGEYRKLSVAHVL